ncbi:MAG: winged helix-turn-helix transcriptional regulator [Euryarchaeota archaeon]|nr:winged helix-turn-helix transcriptional regulator [Euryarchaeota archaeon]MDE1835862.1 winged helix-turn-helix transcriptional regulator [Euryarchaeota archaeon]MDE1882208.1 winged helix-turn-helix transcriptional regulator [Euryarchaeota archaeon]MDE2044460.1 winged helix-turn-helix transcriptional regulator [Thermoplasmata archaeon]
MALHDRPRNAFQLCKDLALDYSTVQHHLRILTENHLVDGAGPRYGRVYVPSQSLEDHWKVMEEILERSERR